MNVLCGWFHRESRGFACFPYASFLLGLLFNSEDEDDRFLQNVGWLLA
jgi:hypothetical protein